MTTLTAGKLRELHAATTQGEWKPGSDAQGPFIVMHPTESGVAIAAFSNAYVPVNGFWSGPRRTPPEPCETAYGGTTCCPERVANVEFLIAAHRDIPELLDRLEKAEREAEYAKALGKRLGALCKGWGSMVQDFATPNEISAVLNSCMVEVMEAITEAGT